MYWQIQSNQWPYLKFCHRNHKFIERARHIAKPDRVIQLNYKEVCTPMQVVKRPVGGRISNTEERICSSFLTWIMIHVTTQILQVRIACLQYIIIQKGKKDMKWKAEFFSAPIPYVYIKYVKYVYTKCVIKKIRKIVILLGYPNKMRRYCWWNPNCGDWRCTSFQYSQPNLCDSMRNTQNYYENIPL